MTKNKKTTPTNVEQLTAVLKWRLAKAPTKEDVTELLDLGIIDKEEAKQLLFSKVNDETSEKTEALKEQIKFLEGVVEKLATRGNTHTVTYWPNYVYTASYPTKYWVTGTSGTSSTIYSMNTGNTVALGSIASVMGSSSGSTSTGGIGKAMGGTTNSNSIN